jgi:hypothetical protein
MFVVLVGLQRTGVIFNNLSYSTSSLSSSQ